MNRFTVNYQLSWAISQSNNLLIAFRPAPKITWKKNGVTLVHGRDSIEIPSQFQGRLLNITNVQRDRHQDQYSCEAENSQSAGNPIKHNIDLQVEGKIDLVNDIFCPSSLLLCRRPTQ